MQQVSEDNSLSQDEVERVAALLKKQRRDRYADEAVASDDLIDEGNAREIIAALVRSKPMDRERLAKAIWATRQDAPMASYSLKQRMSWDEALRAADAAITAIGSQSIEGERVERKAKNLADEARDPNWWNFLDQAKATLAKDEERHG